MPARPPPPPRSTGFLRRRLAIPTEHGAWSWWLVPLLVGMAASRHIGVDALVLALLALTTFLAHQPATVAVKARTGRAPRADFLPALVWTALYGVVAVAAFAFLWARGHRVALLPVAAGLLLFPLHLGLVARRAERRQLAFELVGAAALALWAPAAYVVGVRGHAEDPVRLAALLWLLTALQSSGAILAVYARLTQRSWKQVPGPGLRLRIALPSLAVHTVALVATQVALTPGGFGLAPLAFAPAWMDSVSIAVRPRIDVMPRRIGIHYLVLAAVFVVLMAAHFLA